MDQEKREIGTSSSHDPCAGKECSGGLNLETGYEDHDDKSVEILDDLCPRKSRDKPVFFRLSKNLSFLDYQPVEGIGNSEHHIVNETEVLEANLHCDDNASLNGKESPGCREVDPHSGIDAEVTAVAEDHGDCEDVGFGNDTEFLNVDDDEITEAVDDMPCAEDTRLVENSGWSSRTRAVAKYLQTLLDKEPAHGKKVLGMDSLLNGKTRKEASRMFFETLVLKTRDYIHVEQAKPFDNVSIRSRVKLMKSEF